MRHEQRSIYELTVNTVKGGNGSPIYLAKFAGQKTTVGGAAAEAISVPGVLATDLVFVQLKAVGATPRTILTAVPTANTITVTFSGDPAADHVLYYQVLRTSV